MLELDIELSPYSAEVGNEWSCTSTSPSYLYGIYGATLPYIYQRAHCYVTGGTMLSVWFKSEEFCLEHLLLMSLI
jgi:hypothetical protein